MKKIFTLIAVAMMAVGAHAQSFIYTLNPSDYEVVKVAENTTKTLDDVFTIVGLVSTDGKTGTVDIDANNKTIALPDESTLKVTKRIKFGGTGGYDNRCLKFVAPAAANSIYLYAMSASSSGDNRKLAISDGNTIQEATDFAPTSGGPIATVFNIEAGKTYCIYSVTGAVNIHYIGITGTSDAISSVENAETAKVAPKKVVKNGQVMIGDFNIAGQRVK